MRRCRRVPENQPRATGYDHGDRQNSQHHEETLHAAPGAHAEAIDDGEDDHHGDRGKFCWNRAVRERASVFREGNGHGGVATRIDYQQADPAVEKA